MSDFHLDSNLTLLYQYTADSSKPSLTPSVDNIPTRHKKDLQVGTNRSGVGGQPKPIFGMSADGKSFIELVTVFPKHPEEDETPSHGFFLSGLKLAPPFGLKCVFSHPRRVTPMIPGDFWAFGLMAREGGVQDQEGLKKVGATFKVFPGDAKLNILNGGSVNRQEFPAGTANLEARAFTHELAVTMELLYDPAGIGYKASITTASWPEEQGPGTSVPPPRQDPRTARPSNQSAKARVLTTPAIGLIRDSTVVSATPNTVEIPGSFTTAGVSLALGGVGKLSPVAPPRPSPKISVEFQSFELFSK